MRLPRSLALCSATVALVAGVCHAQSQTDATTSAVAVPNWYIGANVGQSDFVDAGCPSFASCDTRDTAWRLYGGYQFHRHIAVEVGYTDFGKTTAAVGALNADIEASGLTVHAVGLLPLPYNFTLLGKVGAIYGETKTGGSFGSQKDRGTDLAYGVGARYDFNRNFAVRVEWDRFRFDAPGGDSDVDMISAGVQYRF